MLPSWEDSAAPTAVLSLAVSAVAYEGTATNANKKYTIAAFVVMYSP
jgi:hypothetical protein